MPLYQYRTYRRTKPGGTLGELLEVIEIEAPHLAAAINVAEDNYLDRLDFRYDFAVLGGENGHPFVKLWLSNPNAQES